MKMKKSMMMLAFAGLLITSCDNAPKGDETTVSEKQEAGSADGVSYNVDSTASRLRFIGYGVGKNHPGTFKIISGSMAVKNDVITGGKFTIDVRSMNVEEQGDMFQNKLKPHLLSADFFDAANYGTATFEITGSVPYSSTNSDTSVVAGANMTLSGNLTLKAEVKNITFPARITYTENGLEAKADFEIDRRDWKMVYGNDKSLGDKFISEKVNIELDLKATK